MENLKNLSVFKVVDCNGKYINKIQEDATNADIYLLHNYSTCFGCLSHPSSGVHQTVTAAFGTGHITYQGNDLPPAWPKATPAEGRCPDT